MAFHNYRASVWGTYDGFKDKYTFGRNPTNPMIANYRNLHKQDTDYLGGYLTFVWARRNGNFQHRIAEVALPIKKNLQNRDPGRQECICREKSYPEKKIICG
jgi:hypothetical protein